MKRPSKASRSRSLDAASRVFVDSHTGSISAPTARAVAQCRVARDVAPIAGLPVAHNADPQFALHAVSLHPGPRAFALVRQVRPGGPDLVQYMFLIPFRYGGDSA